MDDGCPNLQSRAAPAVKPRALTLTDCLRPTAGVGVALARVDRTAATHPPADPESGDYFRSLVDHVNECLLDDLTGVVPGPAFALAFARGSLVQSRLEVAKSFWARTVECFGLAEIATDLGRSFGSDRVEEALDRLRRRITLKVLRGGDEMGPAKLLVRLARLEEAQLSDSNYPAIEALVAEMARLADGCEDKILDSLCQIGLGEAHKTVRTKLQDLASRFGLGTLEFSSLRFDALVDLLREAECLHPAVPIAKEAVSRVALEFALPAPEALRLITLFRFAWLSRVERTRDLSDLTWKGVLVVPQTQVLPIEAEEEVSRILSAAFEALRERVRSHADVRRFSEIYPDAKVRVTAIVMALPLPLFDLFQALPSGDHRVDFLTRCQMGPAYAQQFVHRLLEDDGHGPALREVESRWNGELNGNLPHTLERVIGIKSKVGKDERLKHKMVRSDGLSPEVVRAWLSGAIQDPDGSHLKDCGWALNEIAKGDLVGNIRGIWTEKR